MSKPDRPAKKLKQKKTLRQRLAGLVALLSVWVVIMFVSLEIFGRVFNPWGIAYFPEAARFFDSMTLEEPIGYRLTSHHEGHYFGTTVRVNSLGLRGPEIPPKQPNERRILVLGDSIVFGVGVEDDETISFVAEKLANENAGGDVTYRLINMGVGSYNTEQQLIQLKGLGMSLEPDAVILLYSPNDIQPKMWVFEKRSSTFVNLAQRSYAVSFFFNLRRWIKHASSGDTSRIDMSQYAAPSPSRSAVEVSLAGINAVCKAANLPFVVFVRSGEKSGPHRLVKRVGDAEGFPTVRLDPWIDPRWKDLDQNEYVNSRVDPHSNAKGCVIFGQLLYELLVAQGIIE